MGIGSLWKWGRNYHGQGFFKAEQGSGGSEFETVAVVGDVTCYPLHFLCQHEV